MSRQAAIRQQQIERDLRLAHTVQLSLLPNEQPKIEGYQFFDFYEPANQVGGDYYDYVSLPGGRLGMVLADVSGKGMAAALVMAKLSAVVRYSLVSELSVARAVQQINVGFVRDRLEGRFITLVVIVVDPKNHELTVVNAGHMPPFLRSGEGRVEQAGAEISGLPLGVDENFAYESKTIPFGRGQILAAFTDGFNEALSANNELYGLNRLRNRIGHPIKDVADLGRIVLEDVESFVGNHPQSDDMCLVCIGRL